MLTITTLLISVVKKLAQTSYIKWIEAWLIFAQLIPFIQVIFITCIEWLRGMKENEKKRNSMNENNEEGMEEAPQRSENPIWLNVGQKLIKVNT